MMTEDDERLLRLPLSGSFCFCALSRLRSQSRPSISCYFRAFSGSACSRMIVCGRNLLQKVRKSLLFSRECITFANGSSKKRDVWTSFRLFRFEILSGEMVEWSITAVLKTAVPRGTGGSNPSLSATTLDYQRFMHLMDDFTHTFSGVVHFSYTYNIDYTPRRQGHFQSHAQRLGETQTNARSETTRDTRQYRRTQG